jgi:hypothetical protein
MSTTKNIYLVLLCTLALLVSSCEHEPPNPGFRVKTVETRRDLFGTPLIFPAYDIGVGGFAVSVFELATGWERDFSGNSGSSAQVDVPGGVAPAVWSMTEINGLCARQRIQVLVEDPGTTVTLNCSETGTFIRTSFYISTQTLDLGEPELGYPTFEVLGTGIRVDYGLPIVEYYDSRGILIAKNRAYEVSRNGRSLKAAIPGFEIPPGTYNLMIKNATASGVGDFIGGTQINFVKTQAHERLKIPQCYPLTETDCKERGGRLDYKTCTCKPRISSPYIPGSKFKLPDPGVTIYEK